MDNAAHQGHKVRTQHRRISFSRALTSLNSIFLFVAVKMPLRLVLSHDFGQLIDFRIRLHSLFPGELEY